MLEKVSISLYASIGGVAAALLTAAVMYVIWGLGLPGLGWAGMTLCITILLVFQISGIAAGVSERDTTLGKAGLVVSIAVITAAVTDFILFLRPHHDLKILILMIIPVPAILMGIFAGVTAVRLQSNQSLKIWKALLILWIMPVVWYALLVFIPAILKGGFYYRDWPQWVTAVMSILFGPWATLAAKLGSWPNAGEFFSLPAAVILTVILAELAAAAIRVRNCTVRGLAVIAFAPFIFVWALVGIGQLLNCTF
jgi:hypothetical protein